jgi:hypothetical protein
VGVGVRVGAAVVVVGCRVASRVGGSMVAVRVGGGKGLNLEDGFIYMLVTKTARRINSATTPHDRRFHRLSLLLLLLIRLRFI